MKKILSLSILISFLLVPALALAAGPIEGCEMTATDATRIESGNSDLTCTLSTGDPTKCLFSGGTTGDTDDCGVCCLLNTLYNVTDWFFVILIAISGIFVVMGAMSLLMSSGDPGKIDKGRNYIVYAIIGLIVGFLARIIPTLAKLVVGS